MAYNGFAIDKYLDADAVNAQLDKLIRSPIYGVLPDALAEYESEYFEKNVPAPRLYMSAAYNEEMIDDVISRLDRVFSKCGKLEE